MPKAIILAATLALFFQAHSQETQYDELLRRTYIHERESIENRARFQFVEHSELASRSETRAVIETTEGSIDRLIALNDQPLVRDQQARQQERLSRLLQDPLALDREISAQKDEARRRGLMVSSLPDAFILEFSKIEPDGRIKFSFRPDPRFAPKNRETQVFKGMRGWIWIDPVAERIAEVKGELFRDVSFGWGILGRLHKGGQFRIVQSQVMPGDWHITSLNLDFKGRLLVFRSLRILLKEDSAMFSLSPPGVDARSAITLLLTNIPAPSNGRERTEIRVRGDTH